MSDWMERGSKRFAVVYGDQTAVVRAALRRGSASLEQYTLACVYGCTLAGDDTTLCAAWREVALLAALSATTADRQRDCHARAAERLLCANSDEKKASMIVETTMDVAKQVLTESVRVLMQKLREDE